MSRFRHIIHLRCTLVVCMMMGVPFLAQAQYKVTVQVKQPTNNHLQDTIYLAGSFNQWNPADPAYRIAKGEATNLMLPEGPSEFKCTRGSWSKVEVNAHGGDLANRTITVRLDTSIQITIEGWKDDATQQPVQHTASVHVELLDSVMVAKATGISEPLQVYVPDGYEKGKQQYPVLYMLDGQNLFDAALAPYGEWGVDECLDTLIAKGLPACIIVGMPNTPNRINDYNPFDHPRYGAGKGNETLVQLVTRLKPFIDARYRTLPNQANTLIAGSSLGGNMATYAILKFPTVFGRAGIFSPAYWITNRQLLQMADSSAVGCTGKLFFYIGAKEGNSYEMEMSEMAASFGVHSSALIYSAVDPAGEHNEAAWRKWLPEFFKWIMADGFNTIVPVKD